MSAHPASDEVLRFEDVTLFIEGAPASAVWDVNLTLAAGELALILQSAGTYLPPIADACAGLIAPAKGAVYFRGQDWRLLAPDRANAMRGTIGRVFADGGWLEHRDLPDNIMLAQLHHTRRSIEDLRAEATQLARTFGLPGLPGRFVLGALNADLQRAACVRALMGSPRAIVLEHPARDVPGILGALINTLHKKRAEGAAVLWITREEQVWRQSAVRPTRKFQLVGSQLVAV